MTETNIKEVIDNEKLPYNTIVYYIGEDGNKKPLNEYNKNPKKIIKKFDKIVNDCKKNDKNKDKFKDKDRDEFKNCYSIYLKLVDNLFVIDIDEKNYDINNLPDIFKALPYTLGNTKGFHLYVYINNFPEYDKYNQTDVLKFSKGDLIRTNNIWEKETSIIYNYDGKIPSIEYEDIKEYVDEIKLDIRTKKDLENMKKKTNRNVKPVSNTIIGNNTDDNNNFSNCILDNNYNLVKELLDIIKPEYRDTYNEWIRIIWSLANNSNYYYLGLEFSNKSPFFQTEDYYKDIWNNSDGSITIGTLRRYARISNEKEYYNIINSNSNLSFLDIYSRGSLSIAKFIQDDIENEVIFCNKEWYIYSNDSGLWGKYDNPFTYIINIIHKYIDNEIVQTTYIANREEKEKKINTINKLYSKIDKGTEKNQISGHLKNLLQNDNFYKKLNFTKGKIVFKNGIYDLHKKIFREGFNYCDYITETLPIEYVSKVNIQDSKYILDRLKEICNNDDTDLDTFLRILGYTFTGYSEKEQYFFQLYGATAANGKSVIFEILDEILPIYSKKINEMTFLDNYSKAHKELILLYNKRFIWCDEIPKNKKLNINLLKEFANGTKLSTEKMYSTNQDVYLSGKLFVPSNNALYMDNDEGTTRRFIQLVFGSKFYDNIEAFNTNANNIPDNKKFLRDNNLKNKMVNKGITLIQILIDYAEKYLDEGLIIPENIIKSSKEEITDNDIITNLINDKKIVIDTNNNDYIIHRDELINLIYNETKEMLNLKILKDLMNKYSIKYNRDKMINNKKGCFIGIKEF